ncbi:MAG: DUF5995 family protein [Bradymonadia bacterium]
MSHDHIHDIDGVVKHLESLIDAAQAERSRRGYFMALYHGVTVRVRRKIEEGGYFEDDARMERFDVIFAKYYFRALDQWLGHGVPSAPWQLAFECLDDEPYLILQHLLLGMNAHIAFDLAQAAAETAPGEAVHDLEFDFGRINDLLAATVDDVQDGLAPHAPLLGLIDRVGGPLDELAASKAMALTREGAWIGTKAIALAQNQSEKAMAVNALRAVSIKTGGVISQRPRRLMRFIRLTESCHRRPHKIDDVIETLKSALA